jgi:hypothetical protein
MDATSMRRRATFFDRVRGLDWPALATWMLCFALVVYLGLKDGGYDPLVHDQVGIAIWWIALAGVAAGALPRRRLPPLAWTALGCLAAFGVWTALSLDWTESVARTSADLARILGYLGIFALALFARASGSSDRVVSAVAAGVAFVALVALLSRLHPAWFPDAGQTALFIEDSRERLSYPLNYWNGLGALIAIGIPLVLHVATSVRSIPLRALAAAALPMMLLTIFFTLSRGGIAAAGIAVAVFLALASDRLPKVLTLGVAVAGGGVLMIAAAQRDALQEGLSGPVAHQQGDELLVIALIVCLVVGLIQAAISLALANGLRPAWTRLSSRQSLVASVLAAVALAIAAGALDAPGWAADGWDEFKRGENPGEGTGRLGSVAGQSRYDLWRAAADQNSTRPLTGTGSGTFELWWARNGTTEETVRDTHSLYLQTLGELGIVGLFVLAAFLLTVFGGGVWNALRGSPAQRSLLAAALAGCSAFCLTAVVDWMWQIPVLAICLLLLASVAVSGVPPSDRDEEAGLRLPLRLGFGLVALVAIAAIAIPLASTSLLRQSEAKVREGDLTGALEAARSAQNVQPDAATPRLQQALVLEQIGDLAAAAEAARRATEIEATDWRNWLVLSRVQAQRGRAAASVRAYRRARSLNPRSAIFQP